MLEMTSLIEENSCKKTKNSICKINILRRDPIKLKTEHVLC